MSTFRRFVKYEDTTGAGVTVPACSDFGILSFDGDSTLEMNGVTYNIDADVPISPSRSGGRFQEFTITKGASATKVIAWIVP